MTLSPLKDIFRKNNSIITVTYKSYIKKDYKPVDMGGTRATWSLRPRTYLLAISFFCCAGLVYYFSAPVPQAERIPIKLDVQLEEQETSAVKPASDNKIAAVKVAEPDKAVAEKQAAPWRSVRVRKGDNLSLIFDRLGLSPRLLYDIVSLSKNTKLLKDLMPGQKLYFRFEDKQLTGLRYEPDIIRTLFISKSEQGYQDKLHIAELEKRTKEIQATIEHSLFLAGQRAGLSDKLIMEMVGIYGWDIDFVLDIRRGDSFKLIYEEHYKGEEKVSEGPILAAEFTNRGDALKAVRYTSSNKRTDYYSENGASMRKAFLRTPLKFSRISSRFSLGRKHPILNRIRSHKGVDYAAPTGTPIKATGDGTIIHVGRKGGYGKTIVIRHGGKYSTLYAHMSRYVRGMKNGKRVKQGQVIGYVGSTGLATGPHLHYEFRLNGVHRNPLTVKLPKAEGISKKEMPHFRAQTHALLAQLDGSSSYSLSHADTTEPTLLAMEDNQPQAKNRN